MTARVDIEYSMATFTLKNYAISYKIVTLQK